MKRELIDVAFPTFSEALRNDLHELGTIKIWQKEELLVVTGDILTAVSILLDGCVEILRESDEGDDFALGFLKKGQSFGVSISEDSPKKNRIGIMTFKAIQETITLQISFETKDKLAKIHDQWYKYILQTAVQYYSIYIDIIDSIAFRQLDTRIEDYLRRLSTALRTKTLKITHLELASALNARRETVSRLLKKMEEDRKVELRQNLIILAM